MNILIVTWSVAISYAVVELIRKNILEGDQFFCFELTGLYAFRTKKKCMYEHLNI